jgi:hypothetical protein
MIDEISQARSAVNESQRDVISAQSDLDNWLTTRTEGGYPSRSLDLNSGRIVSGRVIDTRSWESMEAIKRSAITSARLRLESAETRLRDLRLKNLDDGCRVQVPLYKCFDGEGVPLHNQESVTGKVFAVLAYLCGIRLDSPVGSRRLTEVFAPKSAVLFID